MKGLDRQLYSSWIILPIKHGGGSIITTLLESNCTFWHLYYQTVFICLCMFDCVLNSKISIRFACFGLAFCVLNFHGFILFKHSSRVGELWVTTFQTNYSMGYMWISILGMSRFSFFYITVKIIITTVSLVAYFFIICFSKCQIIIFQ